jgi:PIN domain nuclease of toxin-antitoxin system
MQGGDFRFLPQGVLHTARLINHMDPFDRPLVAQSLVNGLALVNADRMFDAYRYPDSMGTTTSS